MCLYSRLTLNKKYTITKKNGGEVPAIRDIRTKYVPTGCGQCMECRNKKKREWTQRLLEEVKHNKNGKFVTLTFSNDSLKQLAKKCEGLTGYDLENEIATKAVHYFLERWRKKNKKSVRHWLITELGHTGTERIHLHGFIWADEKIKNVMDEVEKHWQYGHVWKGKEQTNGKLINYVNAKTVNYVVKYVSKTDEKHKEYKQKILCTKGIGNKFLTSRKAEDNVYINEEKTKDYYKLENGAKIGLSTYYRNKLFTDEQRENMWINLLNKQTRYVGGEAIDISTNEGIEEYYKTLKHYQAKNKRLGYGDGSINWTRKQYENERRQAKIDEREGRITKTFKKLIPKEKNLNENSIIKTRSKDWTDWNNLQDLLK